MDHQAKLPDWMIGLKNGEFEAWRELYARFGAMIYRVARGMVGKDDAEDVTQNAFLQAFRKRTQFGGESVKQLECWLFRIALNKCRDWRRQRQCRPVCVGVADWSDLKFALPPLEDRLDDLDLFQTALQAVAPDLRAVLLLHLAGRSYREIGRILRIKSIGTVSERMGLAREQLRASLARLGGSECR